MMQMPIGPIFISKDYDFRRLPVVGGTSWRDRRYQLLSPLVFLASRQELVVSPTDRITNFATIPWFIHWLYPPDGPWFDAAVGHDELCDENDAAAPGWKHCVWDASIPGVQELIYEFPEMDRHTFDALQAKCPEWAKRVSSRRAADIMLEMMETEPNVCPGRKRFVIHRSVKWCGPKWKADKTPIL